MSGRNLRDAWFYGRPHKYAVTPRRARFATVLSAALAVVLVGSTFALADNAVADGDNAVPLGSNALSLGTVCVNTSKSGQALIGITRQGQSYPSQNVYKAGTNTTVTAGTPSSAALSASMNSSPATISIPGTWATASNGTLAGSVGTTVTLTAGSTPGAFSATVPYSAAGTESTDSPLTRSATLTVNATISDTGACAPSTNNPPTVGVDNASVTVDEGQTATNTGTWGDNDGDNVSLSASVGSVTKYSGGTWSWSFGTTDGPGESGTVTITANDGNGGSATASFGLTVNNVAPTVERPRFSATSVDCQSSVTLTGISFTDPGVNDDPWQISIEWGDGTNDTYNVNAQGGQSDRTHTYTAPGTYTATVTVTDMDGWYSDPAGSSTNTVVVHGYNVTFLKPFDGASPSSLVTNTMKNGRVVPVKAMIYDLCAGQYVTDGAAVTIKTSLANGTAGSTPDPVEVYADAGASNANTNAFRWTADPTVAGGGFWIYNLDSKNLGLTTGNTYKVDICVGANKATTKTWALLKPVK